MCPQGAKNIGHKLKKIIITSTPNQRAQSNFKAMSYNDKGEYIIPCFNGAHVKSIFSENLNSLRYRVLQGAFAIDDPSKWAPITGKLMVFYSSTFTDTQMERDLLQNDVLKELNKHARSRNTPVIVSFVDMRWGVKDENTLDHQTWPACSKEIERCRKESDGIFFVSLQSHKYRIFRCHDSI